MYFTLISHNHNEYQTTQSRSCLIYQDHEVELIFYSLFIDRRIHNHTDAIFFIRVIVPIGHNALPV